MKQEIDKLQRIKQELSFTPPLKQVDVADLVTQLRQIIESGGILELAERERKNHLHYYLSQDDLRSEAADHHFLSEYHSLTALTGIQKANLLGLLSLSFNGYIREAAVSLMSEALSQWHFPYLILRLQDWVEPVRLKAEELIPSASLKTTLQDWEYVAKALSSMRARRNGAIVYKLAAKQLGLVFDVNTRVSALKNPDPYFRELLWTSLEDDLTTSENAMRALIYETDPIVAQTIFRRF